jgi:hypothetical protein
VDPSAWAVTVVVALGWDASSAAHPAKTNAATASDEMSVNSFFIQFPFQEIR